MEPQVLIIEPQVSGFAYWRELWGCRSLLAFLAWRDLLVRYKQTFIGAAWALLPAIVTTGIFSLVFGHWARLPSDGVPYPLFVLAGALPWILVSNGISQASASVVGSSALVSKVYFPRLLIPMGALFVCAVDFLIALGVLGGALMYYAVWPGWRILLLPLLGIWGLALAMGAGAGLAALNVRYRDVRYVIPFLLQAGLYLSPVGFSSRVVPEAGQTVYMLNPMVGLIDAFRWVVVGASSGTPFPMTASGYSLTITALFWVIGLRYFRRTEAAFADVI